MISVEKYKIIWDLADDLQIDLWLDSVLQVARTLSLQGTIT